MMFQIYFINCKQEAQIMLTNPRDAMLDIYIFGLVWLHYIFFCNYRKANCTPSTAVRGLARDVTSPTTAKLFNCSVFHTLPSEPHPE